jgi:hypothetical protein
VGWGDNMEAAQFHTHMLSTSAGDDTCKSTYFSPPRTHQAYTHQGCAYACPDGNPKTPNIAFFSCTYAYTYSHAIMSTMPAVMHGPTCSTCRVRRYQVDAPQNIMISMIFSRDLIYQVHFQGESHPNDLKLSGCFLEGQ